MTSTEALQGMEVTWKGAKKVTSDRKRCRNLTARFATRMGEAESQPHTLQMIN